MSFPICLEHGKKSCGCTIFSSCNCSLSSFVISRSELSRMTKRDLFELYIRTISDEMSPIMWRGFTKREILDIFLTNGKYHNPLRRPATIPNQVELTPFF